MPGTHTIHTEHLLFWCPDGLSTPVFLIVQADAAAAEPAEEAPKEGSAVPEGKLEEKQADGTAPEAEAPTAANGDVEMKPSDEAEAEAFIPIDGDKEPSPEAKTVSVCWKGSSHGLRHAFADGKCPSSCLMHAWIVG